MKSRLQTNKKGRAGVLSVRSAVCLFTALAAVVVIALTWWSRAYAADIPAGYALDADKILNLDVNNSYEGITRNGDKEFGIAGAQGFVTLARVSQSNSLEGYTFKISARDTWELTVDAGDLEKSFYGIGNDEHPFKGKIYMAEVTGSTYLKISGWNVLFNNLSNEASITKENDRIDLWADFNAPFALCDTLTITKDSPLDISAFRFAAREVQDGSVKGVVQGNKTAGLVAGKVTGSGTCAVDLSPCFKDGAQYALETASGSAGGLFGMIEKDASVSVTTGNLNILVSSADAGNVGLLVGENKGSFTVSSESTYTGSATAAADYAAGLVGVNTKTGTVEFANNVTVNAFTATGAYAGGVAGKSDGEITVASGKTCTVSDSTFTSAATLPMLGGAVGQATVAPAGSFALADNTFEKSGYVGGFIGSFTGEKAADFTNVTVTGATFNGTGAADHSVGGYFGLISGKNAVTLTSGKASAFTFNSMAAGSYGGVIGTAKANSVVTVGGGMTVTNTFGSGGFSGTLGGAVGCVEANAYCKMDGLTLNNTMTAALQAGVGDLVGKAAAKALLDVGHITYTNNGQASVLVSDTGLGTVLRLAGAITDNSASSGHIVRTQTNSLLYADAGYSFARTGTLTSNDVGNYGQILRNDKLHILNFDAASHTVSVQNPLTSSTNITLSSAADAAKLALTLHTHGAVSGVSTNNYKNLLSATITLTGDVDLRGSGVEQFTPANEVMSFAGTINGNDKTLTLSHGESARSNTEDNANVGILIGGVNVRKYMGAFSALSRATVKNLTVDGDVRHYADAPDGFFFGGLACYATNSITIDQCNTLLKITLSQGSATSGRSIYVGGLVGSIQKATVKITNSTTNASIQQENGSYRIWQVFLGGMVGKIDGIAQDVIFTGNTISASITQNQNVTTARVGGCFGDLVCSNYINVDMTGTKAVNASVTSAPSASAGGLIGHTVQKCKLVLDGAWQGTVSSGNASVGGLIYDLDGKLTVNSGFSVNGSAFTSKGGNKGILVGDGTQAFVVVNCDPSGFQTVKADGFDLFVGKNIASRASMNVAATGGLVSVETGAKNIGQIPENSGWYSMISARQNSNARYYFNIARLDYTDGNYKPGAVAKTQADVIYWHVYDYVQGALPDYVRGESFPTAITDITGADKDIDMTNYSFYPTKKEGVTFDFSGHKLTFGYAVADLPRTGQMFGIQSGILSDVIATNESITASLTNITLSGKIFPVNYNNGSSSGAFICGKVVGNRTATVTADANFKVEKVFFDGLTVDGAATPLLIDTIGSNVTGALTSVSQYTQGTYEEVNKTTAYTAKAASALIGKGGVANENGSTASSNISVTFKNIVFAAEEGKSIFTKASYFEAINCVNGTGAYIYNFNLAEDWDGGHKNAVTYGTEISTNPKQYEYYDQEILVDPNTQPTQHGGTNTAFSNGYMPYVLTTMDGGTSLRVNRKSVNFDIGWGTYEHPYIIERAAQLEELTKLVSMSNLYLFQPEWIINYPKASGTALDYTDCDVYTASTSGTLTTSGGTKTLKAETLREYLRGAYFKIDRPLDLTDMEFTGIGTEQYPFHGVIAGTENRTVITLPSNTNVGNTGYCGFINVANGCAVYGLELKYENVGFSGSFSSWDSPTSRAFSTKRAATSVAHFGGAIGWIVGGDNVLDHVTVRVNSLTAGHKTSVFGGYVGLISGGGVTVRSLGDGVDKVETAENSQYFYYAPYVGKAFSGYAISDDQEYKNTEKYASIACIAAKQTTGTFTAQGDQGGAFTLDNAADLMMLGYSMYSGGLSDETNSLSYGADVLSRSGNYAYVGETNHPNVTITAGRYAEDARTDGDNLIRRYFGIPAGTGISRKGKITATLTGAEYDMSQFGNAFRGLGSPYLGAECYNVLEIHGAATGTLVKLNASLKQYCSLQGGKYEPDSVRNMALVMEPTGGGPVLISNITVSGTISLSVYDIANNTELTKKMSHWLKLDGSNNKETLFCLGGFLGYSGGAKFTDVALKDLTIHSPGWAGGLVASEHNQNGSSVNGCVIDSVKLEGLQSTGAVYAFLRAGSNTQLSNVKVTNAQVQTKVSEFSDANNDTYNAATGGLIGCIMNGSISVTDSSVSGSSVQFVSKKTTSSSYNGNAGGFIGTSRASVTFTNCTLDGTEVVACAGYTATAPYPTEYTNSTVDVNGISDGTKNALSYALSSNTDAAGNAGGFVGVTAQANTYTNCVVKSDTAPTAILGYNNGGGVVGEGKRGANYSFTGLSVQGTNHPLYIMGRSCSAGLIPWHEQGDSANAVVAKRVKVSGSASAPVYILATKNSGGDVFASGLLGHVNQISVDVTDAEVSNCIIAGSRAAGILRGFNGASTSLQNIKVFGNYIQSTNSSLAGIFNTVGKPVSLDGLYFADNMLRSGFKDKKEAGGIVDTISEKGVLNGCNILMKNNDMAFTGSAKSFTDILKMTTMKPSGMTGTDYKSVGLIGYKNTGTANILAFSSEAGTNINQQERFVTESSGKTTVIFAGYGAPSVFETEYFGKKNTAYTPAQALADHGVTPVKTDKLNGDAVTATQGSATPVYLNANLKGWAAWKDKTVKLEDTGIKTLSALTADKLTVTQNTDLPVLSINGATQQTMSSFLNLLTGGGFGAMGRAYTLTVQADRYTLGNDGTLSLQAKGDGSVLYYGQKFTAGKYDDLESENKSLTVLTLTFRSSAVPTQTYSMNVVVYYPQILEYKSYISALEGEVYQLSSFLTAPKTSIDVSAGSKYSLYVEYAYNDTAKKIENFNFDKRIESGTSDGSAIGNKSAFVKGTGFVLVDLNSPGAYGYKSYYYTAPEDTYTLNFSSFWSEAGKPFTVKLLPEVVKNLLVNKDHLCKDANYGHVERYLLMVIPQTAEQLIQYTLRATVAENDRNIIVRDHYKEKCSVNVWGKATGKMELETPAKTFSNVVGKELVVNAHVQVDFPNNYISAMHDRDIYGTHVFKIMDANNKAVSLPAGTKALLTGKDGKTLLATRVTTPTSTVRYELDNIVSLAPRDSLTDDFVLTLDFSEVSPADFSGVFADGGLYTLQDEFYISSDRAHYTNGSKIEGSTFSFTAKTAVPVKLTVIPVDRKSQAINMGGVKDSTDSGKILFDLVADFSAVPEKDRKNIESAKVEFFLYQKQYDADSGKHVYSKKNLPGPLGTVDADGRTVLPLTTDWKATGQYTLSVNLDYVLEQMKTDYQGILSNYRLMAKVTGLDASGNAVGSYSAESYFVFLLCDIDNQIGA